jgi:hypothetical protein
VTTVGLFCKKSNTGPRSGPIGYRIAWRTSWEQAGDRIEINRTDLRDIPDLADHVPLKFRIAQELRVGALTIADLAARLEVPMDSVKKALARGEPDRFVRVTGDDGVFRWGLAHAS